MPHFAILKDVEVFEPGTKLLTFAWEAPVEFTGGQWLLFNSGVPVGDKPAKRAYSILSADSEESGFQIALRRIESGPASTHLMDTVKVGDRLEFSGPYGKNYVLPPEDELLDPSGGPALFFATETGITAALGAIASKRFKAALKRVRLIWFLPKNEPNYFLPPDWVREVLPAEVRDNFSVEYIDPPGEHSRLEQARRVLDKFLEEGAPGPIFLSGDGHVVKALRATLTVNEVPERQIRAEPYFNNKAAKTAPPEDTSGLRTGFTTGACSAAAARAAARAVLTQQRVTSIEITLPNRQTNTFSIKRCDFEEGRAICSVIKDAGDDPDCTHGAELTAEVRLIANAPDILIRGGDGVATVTKPGIGIEVGSPSITSMPLKNIREMVQAELRERESEFGAEVTVSVPRGREMALETTNARLGLVGGISILGTTGVVKPYSTAAYRTSIVQGIDVAYNQGNRELVMTTGGRSEQYAMEFHKHLPEGAFIQVGDFIGVGIKQSRRSGFHLAHIFGMIGKLSKMADGVIQTHQAGSAVNMDLLADFAAKLGAETSVQEQIRQANTGRHVLEICQAAGLEGMTDLICAEVVRVMTNHAIGKPKADLKSDLLDNERPEDFEVRCYLTDFNGKMIGRYPGE